MAKILVIDSGFGGLSFVKKYTQITNVHNDIIYFGDNARAPYGVRSKDELYRFAIEIIEFVARFHQLDAVVVACGTISTNVLPQLQAYFSFPIIGVSQSLFKIKNVFENVQFAGAIATEKTIESQFFQENLNKVGVKKNVAMPTQVFVDYVEGKTPISDDKIIEMLTPFQEADCLILGCTHFPFLNQEIQNALPRVRLIDPGEYVVEYIDALFPKRGNGTVRYYTSGDIKLFEHFLEKNQLPKGDVVHEDTFSIE